MNTQTASPVTVDVLKGLYLDLKDRLIKESDITEDITALFLKGLRQKISKGEQLKIVIRGQTTKGKSTTGLYLKWIINQMIQTIPNAKKDSTYKPEYEYDLIASNQIEFLRIARKTNKYKQVCCQIDEFSDMGKSGMNSTTEENLLSWYDKVCAQCYIHLIYCTPVRDYDKYGLIILDIVDVDKKDFITKLKVYYNNPTDNYAQFLGYITLNVKEILNKKWYSTYRKKKHFAMNLLLNKGIMDIRKLEFALVSLIAYKKSLKEAKLGLKENEMIKIRVRDASQETQAVYSMLSENDVIGTVKALITPVTEIVKIKSKLNNPKITHTQRDQLMEELRLYTELKEDLYKTQTELLQLYKEYTKIGNESKEKEITKLEKQYNLKISTM